MMGTTSNDQHGRAPVGRGMEARSGEARSGEALLERIGEASGYVAGEGRPDIRGWTVVASDGRRIGKVHDLLVDRESRLLRWMDVEVDRATVRSGEARCVLVPVGLARLDGDRREVRLPTLSGAAAALLPGCVHGPVSRDREREILGHLHSARPQSTADDSPAGLPGAETDFYDHPLFHDRDFWGTAGA